MAAEPSSHNEILAQYARGVREFEGLNLIEAHLTGVKLPGAIIRRSTFARAHLEDADLAGADLQDTDLSGTHLERGDLSGARFERVNLSGARLSDSNLSKAGLLLCLVRGTVLTNTDFRGTSFWDTRLELVDLTEVSVSNATFLGGAVFINVHLGVFCRTKLLHHHPSTVDVRSIVRSVSEPRLKDFLRDSGMPDVFVQFMYDCARSLSPEQVFTLLQSTFISYGGPDELFARKLSAALQAKGVRTFVFKEHALPGEKLHRMMHRAIQEHDRVILVCSRDSLNRQGLLNELEETVARQARDGGADYLIPIRLDDYVFNGWNPHRQDLAQAVRDRVVADFTDHHDPVAFERELSRLVEVLKKPVVHL